VRIHKEVNREEYVNPQWLMQMNAPDRGRDLPVEPMVQMILAALSGIE
jgi:hypothetical protein